MAIIGQQLVLSRELFFLKTGITSANFKLSGNIPVSKDSN